MYRTRLGRYIFFCLFLVNSCQKIHFIVFFGAFYLPHLMHSVTQNVHLTHSMHEVWQIRGRHFSTARGNFSRQIAPRMSARSARDSIMRPPRHQSRENAKRAASAACQRVDCGISKTC